MVRYWVVLIALGLSATACGEPTVLPPFGDSGGMDECGGPLADWDATHPLPDLSLTVLLDGALVTGPGGSSAPPGADGDRSTTGTGTAPEDIIIELSEPTDIRGIRHYPATSGDGVSQYEVFLGDDSGCDSLAGEAVVALGPFFEDIDVTPRVASRVRIAVLGAHGTGSDFAVADFQLLAGADFATSPMTTGTADDPWLWDASATIPGVGPITYSLTEWPTGMAVDAEGIVTWTPHVSQVGVHMVHLIARRGGDAMIQQRFIVTVGS